MLLWRGSGAASTLEASPGREATVQDQMANKNQWLVQRYPSDHDESRNRLEQPVPAHAGGFHGELSCSKDFMLEQGKDLSPRAASETTCDELTIAPISCVLLEGRRQSLERRMRSLTAIIFWKATVQCHVMCMNIYQFKHTLLCILANTIWNAIGRCSWRHIGEKIPTVNFSFFKEFYKLSAGPQHMKEVDQVQRRVMKMIRRLEHLSCEDRLGELDLFSLEKRCSRKLLAAYLKETFEKAEEGLFERACSDRRREQQPMLRQGVSPGLGSSKIMSGKEAVEVSQALFGGMFINSSDGKREDGVRKNFEVTMKISHFFFGISKENAFKLDELPYYKKSVHRRTVYLMDPDDFITICITIKDFDKELYLLYVQE
ncbi:hypothetical protein WISP_94163 [Willisornis vidua]|uniref:Uncharacterized protein n=1 Tax=Willisornis vidua TaxID=1566151 RepID=A0ABQ9D0G2_9PASS|nr:hypothetical protein WISP_94163 [Willisornis vidua]